MKQCSEEVEEAVERRQRSEALGECLPVAACAQSLLVTMGH